MGVCLWFNVLAVWTLPQQSCPSVFLRFCNQIPSLYRSLSPSGSWTTPVYVCGWACVCGWKCYCCADSLSLRLHVHLDCWCAFAIQIICCTGHSRAVLTTCPCSVLDPTHGTECSIVVAIVMVLIVYHPDGPTNCCWFTIVQARVASCRKPIH